jgi:hypothetical protein
MLGQSRQRPKSMQSKALEPTDQSGPESRRPESECKAIQEQLERILADPLFRNSRRYPNLLRYVVEQTLQGRTTHLKERTLGVEVFGREPDYDTNLDPVVRTTAGEIRKRIAQYYHEPGRENEIRIDLPLGSYVPEIRLPAASRAVPVEVPQRLLEVREAPKHRSRPFPFRPWQPGGLVLVVLASFVFWLAPRMTNNTLEKFWSPIVEGPNPVLVCVGRRDQLAHYSDPDISGETSSPELSPAIPLRDVTAVARVAGVLQMLHKDYRIQADSGTSFADLRSGPVVLIGSYNNNWTVRLTGLQRFRFEQSGEVRWIADRENPSQKDWSVNLATPIPKLTEDYALVSRLRDPTTDRITVVAAGLRSYGTAAAGEFLTNSEYLATIVRQAPKNWERKNLQVVLATKVINGNSGPPRVVAIYFW